MGIGDSHPPYCLTSCIDFGTQYLLYNAGAHRTDIWDLSPHYPPPPDFNYPNFRFSNGFYGPTFPVGWNFIGLGDFDLNGYLDYVLFNPSTGQTAIWYMWVDAIIGYAYGPTVPTGWALVAVADFNLDGHPDFLLYNATTRQTAIYYLNNNVFIGYHHGPTLPSGWSLTPQ